MKHYEVTKHNGHWPLTFKTDSVADAYDCVSNLLSSTPGTPSSYRTGFLMALAEMEDGKTTRYTAAEISVCTLSGEV